MVLLPDHARQRNNFNIIPLARPRIEREVDADGLLVLRGDRGWLCRRPPRCDGPRRSPRLYSEGHHRVDRTRGVETLRGRQPGGTKSLRTILQKWKGAR